LIVDNYEIVEKILGCRAGSVIAPAGCGKTECIVDVVKKASERYLVLTHTLAGVDSLRKRLKQKGVNAKFFDLETIAGWSLRFARAFPRRSGLTSRKPGGGEWPIVYAAAERLVVGGFITSVLKASYKGVLVDEYQDCTLAQHRLVASLLRNLPVFVFGDPLQAIFGFREDKTVDWNTDVKRSFPQIGKLTKPWRWNRVPNYELGAWLMGARDQLVSAGQVDLSDAPLCVSRISPKSFSKEDIRRANVKAGLSPKLKDDETLIVISDKASEVIRASLASKIKCTTIEPIACRSLSEFIASLKLVNGKARLKLVLDFAENAMTGVNKTAFERRVHRLSSGWLAKKTRTEAEQAALDVLASGDLRPVLNLLEALRRQGARAPHRRELLSATCKALRLVIAGEKVDLESAVWHVQNEVRHAGRRLAKRSVGSTLLIKGLQFDHAVIIAPDKLSKNDLYVALTRASKTITVVSGAAILKTKEQQPRGQIDKRCT
jgi:UvrD/REP helicase N-terminal domain